MTALLSDPPAFHSPAARLSLLRFICEHLHLSFLSAWTSRIDAQVPTVTAGKLALRQQILRGIDVAIMVDTALRAGPLAHIEPQLIQHVPAPRI